MAKIAVELQHALDERKRHGMPGRTAPCVLARGDGWVVADVVCTCGPDDRPYEEQHSCFSIAIVLAGSFQYRSSAGRGLMTPGSLMLGNRGECFECGHEHGEGDRCLSFSYEPEYFERLTGDAVRGPDHLGFDVARLPPLRVLAPVVARAAAGVSDPHRVAWEEFAVELAARAVIAAAGVSAGQDCVPPDAEARVTRAVRLIDCRPDSPLTLERLARVAGLSPFHFLRTFERVTGITPHQYVLRARLRHAVIRLAGGSEKVVDIALDCGFGDVSNFNRAFRTEFGVSPRELRVPSKKSNQVRYSDR